MRASVATVGSMLGLLLVVVPSAWASRDCRGAFEKWAILSGARVRAVPQSESGSGNGRGACVPTEAVRRELLDGLARALTLCAASPDVSDRSVQQTAALLNINQSFIASLALCRSDGAEPGAGWLTKSAPAEKKPAPPPAPPKAVVAAPPPAPPKPVAAAPPPTPPCLEIAPAKEGSYALVNRRCRGHTVFAVIETRGAAGETVCRGYAISKSVAVNTARNAPPLINHECLLNQHGPCNKDRLGGMFPECDF